MPYIGGRRKVSRPASLLVENYVDRRRFERVFTERCSRISITPVAIRVRFSTSACFPRGKNFADEGEFRAHQRDPTGWTSQPAPPTLRSFCFGDRRRGKRRFQIDQRRRATE